MAAFQDAVDLGYRYLETDVHASADGVLFAFHDPDLRRTCGIDAAIGDLTSEIVEGARVAGTEPIPRLDAVLDAWPDARINIDCKSEAALAPLLQVLRRPGILQRVCVGAFSDSRLRRLREELGPDLCSSLGPREVAGLAARAATGIGTRGGFSDAQAAQVPPRQGPVPLVTNRFLEACADLGLQVHVWTIDDPGEIARLLDLGVHGIMSDDTRALRDVLVAREQWH